MAIQEWYEGFEEELILGFEWFAQPNDLIGGWCVMPTNVTPGKSNIPEVADFTSEKHARHIAELHNAWLKEKDGQGK